MGAGLVMMVLFGCGDGGELCERLVALPAVYATVAECNLATRRELPLHTDYAYPVIAARCELSEPRIVVASAGR